MWKRAGLLPCGRCAVVAGRAPCSSRVCAAMPTRPAGDPTLGGPSAKKAVELDASMMAHLERQSLVRFTSRQAQLHLTKAIEYADRLKQLDVTGVQPMYAVFEDQTLRLRHDTASTTVVSSESDGRPPALAHIDQGHSVENYFVTPPGNIALQDRSFDTFDQQPQSAIIQAKRDRNRRKRM